MSGHTRRCLNQPRPDAECICDDRPLGHSDGEAREHERMASETRALRAENERLRGLIEGVEFEFVRDPFVSDFRCPWCNGESKDGHAPDCPAFSARGEVRR